MTEQPGGLPHRVASPFLIHPISRHILSYSIPSRTPRPGHTWDCQLLATSQAAHALPTQTACERMCGPDAAVGRLERDSSDRLCFPFPSCTCMDSHVLQFRASPFFTRSSFVHVGTQVINSLPFWSYSINSFVPGPFLCTVWQTPALRPTVCFPRACAKAARCH